MKKVSHFVILAFFPLLLFSATALAQISQGGMPLSLQVSEKESLSIVPFEKMPEVNVTKFIEEDKTADLQKDIPWRFGIVHQVSINPSNSGTWDILPDGTKIWRLGINCPSALSVNVMFNEFILPKGAKLFVYAADKDEMLGAFTDFNNQEDGYFAVSFIFSENIIIEYNEPKSVEFSGILNLAEITHGYRTFMDYAKAFGGSGSCNKNVACPEAAGMEDQIRSVAMLATSNGVSNGFCSGSLINNTANDGTPYFLSANHCYSAPGGVFFIFNWQSATCANPSTSPSFQSISGATDKARNAASDFWLMQLNATPPANYNVYYSGWNRTTSTSLSEKIWGIHHPSGDIKKISWANGGVTTSAYGGGTGTTHWRVVSWSDGTTTEGGSSGSPLFDASGKIIGQLHGGAAACGNTLSDYYGKLGVSWVGGGTNATRLSNWLDPSNSGVTSIEGYDPNAISVEVDAQMLSINAPAAEYLAPQSITPSVVVKNRGTNNLTAATVSYTLNGGAAVNVEWTGNLASNATATVTFPAIDIVAGNHTFVATVTVANDAIAANNNLTRNFTVHNCGATAALPFNEGFEGGALPGCWSQEHVIGTINWQFGAGNGGSNPASAYQGTKNAYFKVTTSADKGKKTRIITPKLGLAAYMDVQLKFYYQNQVWVSDQDILRVFYKNSSTGTWTLLNTYSTNVTSWTLVTISIPNGVVTDDFYIAFEAEAQWGYGVCIDEVSVTGTPAGTYANFTGTPTTIEVGQSVTFTDVSGGGAITSWSWNFGQGASPSTATGQGPHIVSYNTVGLKTVSLTINDNIVHTKNNYINVTPSCAEAISSFPHLESFEGTFTPTCWALENTSANTWVQTSGYTIAGTTPITVNAQSGTKFAYVQWLAQNQNEKLISPKFNFTGKIPTINFWFNGSYHWSVVNPNCDLNLLVSVNNGPWTKVWTETDHPQYTSTSINYTWLNTQLQLNGYVNQNNVRFMFQYTGNDGANFGIDNIVINGITVITNYTITASAGTGGTITPSGSVVVAEGNSQTFTIAPSVGYAIADVLVNGSSVGAVTEYTFSNVMSNHTIAASFAPITYTLAVDIVGNGSVTVNGNSYNQPVTINHGLTANVVATATEGWAFANWSGDLVSTLATESIVMTGNKAITATFTETTSIGSYLLANINIYPNPFGNKLNINNVEHVKVITFTNVVGQKVAEYTPNGQSNVSIETGRLAKGIYMVTFRSFSGEKVMRKIVKQ